MAQSEIIIFADDDMVAPCGWIKKFLHAFEKNPQFAVIQAGYAYVNLRSIFAQATAYSSCQADKVRIIPSERFSEGREADYIGTGNLAVHKKRLQNFDLKFDERLITREDEDFFRSLRKAGVAIGFIDNTLMHRPSVGVFADVRRYFFYGRGGYHLRQKWGNYKRLRHDNSSGTIYKTFGLFKGQVVIFIVRLRVVSVKWGYRFEKKLSQWIRRI